MNWRKWESRSEASLKRNKFAKKMRSGFERTGWVYRDPVAEVLRTSMLRGSYSGKVAV